MPNTAKFEALVGAFLKEYPQHIEDVARHEDTDELIIRRPAILPFCEYCLRIGAYSDRAKLEASIARLKARG